MPEKKTIERAKEKKREGKSPSTQAGEFVREEMEHIRQGKHGARSTKQAIAIGLSKARRAGVNLPPRNAKDRSEAEAGKQHKKTSKRRSQTMSNVLKREPHAAASHRNLSKQAHQAARKAARTRTHHACAH